MKAFFLEAAVPLTKTFRMEGNELKKIGHPRIIEYTSHERQFNNIDDLYALLKLHADKGHCFLKGELSRPLVNESRAGSTDANAPTRVLLLDLDGIRGIDDVDQFLTHFNLQHTDYIVQYSSSMGIDPDRGMSAHIFMLLEKPTAPALIKQWLIHMNLTNPILVTNLRLTRTHNAIRWPLDITTCQNDKLIYITPPICEGGVKDQFKGDRIQLAKGRRRYAKIPDTVPTSEANRIATETSLNELRAAAGLPKRTKTHFKVKGSVEYMAKPDVAIVTSIKRERGFIYLNINGGDSWGYYHPENNPEFIFNFKSEPVYRTQELLPDYYAELQKAASESRADSQGNMYLAFRDFKTSAYWNGIYNLKTQELELSQAKSKDQLKDFLKQHGQPVGDFIPDWQVTFDPQWPEVVDADARTVNLFQPSMYMRMAPKPVKQVPPTIRRVISHALGNDDEVFEHFMNWLAVILQHRTRTLTAWVLHGTQGTGKGVMLHKILSPLFGERYVTAKRMEELDSQFNAYMEQCFILFIDEAQLSEYQRSSAMNASLKNYIAEPRISVRRMYATPYMAENYLNLIFASNMPDPVIIDPEDRRFNVATYQDKRLILSDAEFEQIEIELLDFYHYLASREANREKARTPLNNAARDRMINIGRASIDVACDAILKGDLQFFWEQLPSGDLSLLPAFEAQRAENYETLLKNIVKQELKTLTREELYLLLEYTIGGMPKAPHKFTSLIKHYRIHIEPVYREKTTRRGVHVDWQITENIKQEVVGETVTKPAVSKPRSRRKKSS